MPSTFLEISDLAQTAVEDSYLQYSLLSFLGCCYLSCWCILVHSGNYLNLEIIKWFKEHLHHASFQNILHSRINTFSKTVDKFFRCNYPCLYPMHMHPFAKQEKNRLRARLEMGYFIFMSLDTEHLLFAYSSFVQDADSTLRKKWVVVCLKREDNCMWPRWLMVRDSVSQIAKWEILHAKHSPGS